MMPLVLQKSRATRLEARRAWTIGRLLDALRGTRIFARSKRNQAESLEFSREPLKSPDSRKEKIWILLPFIFVLLPLDFDFVSHGFCNPSVDLGSRAFHVKQLSRESAVTHAW
jgi:hypothetical protein